jgi:Tfp pilus assembly protein PilV
MIEILIIVAVISVGIMTLLTALRSSNTYVQKTRQKIIAINLAREGMEQVYNIRDTNWQRREGKKE